MRNLPELAFELATRVGVGEQALRVADRLGLTSHAHLDGLAVRRDVGGDPDGSVLLPLIPGSTVNSYRLALLGYAFRTRGYDPIHLVGDDAFDVVPNETIHDDRLAAAVRSRYEARRTARAFGVSPVSVTDVLGGRPAVSLPTDCESVCHRGVPISEYARASTRKYFKRYDLDWADQHVREVYRRFLRVAVVLTEACESIFAAHDVRAVVTIEDPYVHGGVPLAVAANHAVPAYSHEVGFRNGTVVFGRQTNRNSLPQYTRRDCLERVVDEPLTETQRVRTDRAMARRKRGGGLYNYSAVAAPAGSYDDDDRTHVGLFTTLVWDAATETNRDGVTASPLEWVGAAVDELGGREDVRVVVKTHPAEDVYETEQTVEGWLRDREGSLPSNVDLCASDADVDTYDLIERLDVGVVYCSTVGLEMAYENVPVVVVGDAHYRNLGFTFDPASWDEYRALLADVGDLTPRAYQRALATRYLHFLFFRKCIDFPFFTSDRETTDLTLLPAAHEDLRPGTEPFDTVVRSILADEPVLAPHTSRV